MTNVLKCFMYSWLPLFVLSFFFVSFHFLFAADNIWAWGRMMRTSPPHARIYCLSMPSRMIHRSVLIISIWCPYRQDDLICQCLSKSLHITVEKSILLCGNAVVIVWLGLGTKSNVENIVGVQITASFRLGAIYHNGYKSLWGIMG